MIIGVARVMAAGQDVAPGHVVVEGERIVRIGSGIPPGAEHVFPRGALVPGFIDLQVNGAAGVDLLDCDPAGVERVSAHLASTGTTGFLPTLITAPLERIAGALGVIRRARPAGAAILGVHIEGPALSAERRGAHDAGLLRQPGDPDLRRLYESAAPDLRLVTLAPELPGALELIAWLAARGVTVSLGHSNADYGRAAEALRQGARMATHLFNGMRSLHHREPGVVGAVLDDPHCICGVIADGHHVHPAVIRLVWRGVGAGRLAVVTDATAPAGMPPGEYHVMGRVVRVDAQGPPRLPDGTFMGTALRMDEAVRNLVSWGVPLRDAVGCATAVPARVLGLTDRGELAEGLRADLCVLGEDGRAVLTVVDGRTVFARPAT